MLSLSFPTLKTLRSPIFQRAESKCVQYSSSGFEPWTSARKILNYVYSGYSITPLSEATDMSYCHLSVFSYLYLSRIKDLLSQCVLVHQHPALHFYSYTVCSQAQQQQQMWLHSQRLYSEQTHWVFLLSQIYPTSCLSLIILTRHQMLTPEVQYESTTLSNMTQNSCTGLERHDISTSTYNKKIHI